MTTPRIFGSWLHRHSQPDWGWQGEVRQEIARELQKGMSRQEVVGHLAKQMYTEDMQDGGFSAEMGFFTWQLYLGAAQFVVDSLVPVADGAEPHTPGSPTNGGQGGKAA